MEKSAYNERNKSQEGDSLVRRSVRLRNKFACKLKNDRDYECKGKERRTIKKKWEYFGNNEWSSLEGGRVYRRVLGEFNFFCFVVLVNDITCVYSSFNTFHLKNCLCPGPLCICF